MLDWKSLRSGVPVNLDAVVVVLLQFCLQDDEMADRTQPISEPIAPPKKETAWERGLKLAREVSTDITAV